MEHNKSHKYYVRGIGLDRIPSGCFCCGKSEKHYINNISGFVENREEGQAITDFFGEHGARLDYRDWEPNWIQVKIGSCDEHLPNLRHLEKIIREADNNINNQMVIDARNFVDPTGEKTMNT
jgi:hypothetical protein